MYSIVCLYLSYKQSPFSYYYDNPVMLDWGVVSQLTSNNHVSLLYCGSLFSVGHCSEIERGRGRVDQFPSTLLIVSCTDSLLYVCDLFRPHQSHFFHNNIHWNINAYTPCTGR